MTIVSTPFVSIGKAQSKAEGVAGMPLIVIDHPFGNRKRADLGAIAERCCAQIAETLAKGGEATSLQAETAPTLTDAQTVNPDESAGANRLELPDDLDEINHRFRKERWGDGLPIVPPTRSRVEHMVAASGRAPQDLIGLIPPAFGTATVEIIAINAVMAGCDPTVMPVLLAAVEALTDAALNLRALQATTNPVAIWAIVSGPLADTLGFNSGMNALGEGNWVNNTFGRALRLILRNVGGAMPGDTDKAQHGQPGRLSFCCGENQEHSPWTSLREEYGYSAEDSIVTVVGAEGTLNMNTITRDPDQLISAFALSMMHPASNEYIAHGEPWLIVGPEHAAALQAGGYDKEAFKRVLWEKSKQPASQLSEADYQRMCNARKGEFAELGKDTLLPISRTPNDIRVLVAGGPGTHSVYVPSFGDSTAVSRRIAVATSQKMP